jgi:hypothetical protein
MTVKKKLSMAERLAQIANPTPSSEDIETIPDGARISRNADDEFVYDDYAGLTTQVLMECFHASICGESACNWKLTHCLYTTRQPSALRRDLGLDIVDDLKYKGVTVSRRQLMAGSDDDDDDDEDDDDDRDEDEKDETEDADGDSDGAPGEENDLIRDEDQSEVGVGDGMECGMLICIVTVPPIGFRNTRRATANPKAKTKRAANQMRMSRMGMRGSGDGLWVWGGLG